MVANGFEQAAFVEKKLGKESWRTEKNVSFRPKRTARKIGEDNGLSAKHENLPLLSFRNAAFSQSKEKSALLDFLISGYSNLLSLLWKMWRQENFSFAVTRRDGILRKIDSVKETEEKVYDCLWEACA